MTEKEKETLFNIPTLSIEEIKKMVGQSINAIDLTPFTAMTGIVLGIVYPLDDNIKDLYHLILLVDKDYQPSDELKEFKSTIYDFLEMTEEETLSMIKSNKTNIDIDSDYMILKFNLTEDIFNSKEIILLPFTHLSSDFLDDIRK